MVSGKNRGGRPQENVVRYTLAEVLMRGDPAELNGFCAGLSEICGFADESGDYYRDMLKQADRRERLMRRIGERKRSRAVRA